MEQAARTTGADIVLVDVGPNLGAINRSAIIAAHHIITPMAADLFSLQGLENLGPTLQEWKRGWGVRMQNWQEMQESGTVDEDIPLPEAKMHPLGYVLMQFNTKARRPVKAYQRWIQKIPAIYSQSVLDQSSQNLQNFPEEEDPNCLSHLKHYYSLMPLAQEARKPMFLLSPADGAIGAHMSAVHDCYQDFKNLSKIILNKLS